MIMEEMPELRNHVLDRIHAARDIRIYRTTVVATGTPGVVVSVHMNPGRATYTVEFQPAGLAGATIRVGALNDADLQEGARPGPSTEDLLTRHNGGCSGSRRTIVGLPGHICASALTLTDLDGGVGGYLVDTRHHGTDAKTGQPSNKAKPLPPLTAEKLSKHPRKEKAMFFI